MALHDHNDIGSDGAFSMAVRGMVGSLRSDGGSVNGSRRELVIACIIYGIRYNTK